MIPSTFDPLYFKTVPPTYSWDQGTPGVNYDPFGYITGLSSVKASSTLNDEKVEYVGYAPFVYFSLSSFPGELRDDYLALERTVDFGDYYNSESNIVTIPGLSSEKFCHIYVMPGLYTITYTRTEHTYYEYIDIDGSGNCLQKYCIDWSYGSLKSDIARKQFITWGSAQTGGIYQKKWEFERCEASEYMMAGLYIQPTDKAVKHPLSWQWYNFLCTPLSGNTRNDPINWLSAGFQQDKQFTWKNSAGPCVNLPIEGITWRWERLTIPPLTATVGEKLLTKNITWDQVALTSPKATTWDFAKNNCSTVGTIVLSANKQTIVKKAVVRVKEIPPTAYLTVEQPEDRLSPLTVRLSPRNTICGSFPIEKIVWDLGDGSPLIEQTRWSNTLKAPFAFSGALGDDYEDPRNYDVIHTYVRSATSPATFYPSMTAFAANTYTADSASVMVGPLKYQNTDGSNFRLLQSELTDQGKALLGQIDDTNVGLWRIDTIFKEVVTIAQTYYYFGYYSADRPLKNGQSVLYKGIYSNSPRAALLNGRYAFTEDLAEGGSSPDLDAWQTDENGVISWSKYIAHPIKFETFIPAYIDPSLPIQEPYKPSFNYFVDTPVLTSGVSKLYSKNGLTPRQEDTIGNELFDNLDIDKDGRIDTVQTNANGIITWEPKVFNISIYPGLSGYTRTVALTSGVSKLYDSPYSDANIVRLEEGTSYLNVFDSSNLYEWTTGPSGIITFNIKVVHPYSVGTPAIGYIDQLNLVENELILWNGVGTGAQPITLINGLTSDIDGDGHADVYFTDDNGILRWDKYILHPFSFGDSVYFTDQPSSAFSTELTGFLWNNTGSNATKVVSVTGINIINNSDSIARKTFWRTDSNGILSLTALRLHQYQLKLTEDFTYNYYTDDAVPQSRNLLVDPVIPGSLIWDDFGLDAGLVLNQTGIGDVDGDGNNETWSTNEIGRITFAMITAHPYKQFNNYWTDQPTLTNGQSILWNGKGTGATIIASIVGSVPVDVDGDGSLDSWYTLPNGVINWVMYDAHPWAQFTGFTDGPFLQNGVTVLWKEKGSNSAVLSSLSGIWDVDSDGNFDVWYTDALGTLSWATLTAHPYLQSQLGPYYTDTPELTSGVSVLWNDYKSSARMVSSVKGIYDFEGDGDLDAWQTNSVGRLTWSLSAIHPYFKFNRYYADTPVLVKGASKLWDKPGTSARVVSGENGLNFIDGDSDLDYWTTDDNGVIDWKTSVFYDHPFLDTQYFTEFSYLEKGKTVVWSGQYSSSTPVANVSGEYIDINQDGDELIDVWTTNNLGVVSWDKKVIYPYQFPGLSGFTDTEYISSGTTILRETKYIGSAIVPNVSGIYLNRDNDLSEWEADENGVITWTLLSAHPYSQSILGSYYTDTPELTSGVSILWNKPGTGAIKAVGATGQALINQDGDLDLWTTNTLGVIAWVTLSSHPYPQFYGYSDTANVVSGSTKLWNKPTSTAVAVALSSGTADVNNDANLDTWSTNSNGIITFALISTHPFKQSFGYYTDTQQLVRNETVVWNGPGTGAIILSGFVFPNQNPALMIDLDGDLNVDYHVTNPNGTYSWKMYLKYPTAIIDGSYFSNDPSLVSGFSKAYLSQGSNATFATSISNTIYLSSDGTVLSLEDGSVITYYSDVQGKGNLASWSIDEYGYLTFEELVIYPYQPITGYYTLNSGLTSGVSKLYNGSGTAATLAVNVSGSAQLTDDNNLDLWTTDSQGVISWVTLTAHPFEQFLGFTDTPSITPRTTVIYNTKFSGAEPFTYGQGKADVDRDGNIDFYTFDTTGTVSWYTMSAHPFLQFPGSISAADIRVVTTPISVAGNPQIEGTAYTYYLLTAFDTILAADGSVRPFWVQGNTPVPDRPFEQTYTVLTAADVAPVIIDGVTLTEQISVAGNLDIPGTPYTYQMIPRRDGYTDLEIPNTGDILYKHFGSGSLPLTGAQGYSLVGPHSANWNTNSSGSLTINYVSAHPYFQFYRKTDDELKTITDSYYTDTPYIISGVSILWDDYRTGARFVPNLAGVDDIDRDGTEEEWHTDENGIIYFKLTITIGTYFYATVSRDWYDLTNWYIYSNRAAGANRLPLSSTNVVILSGTLTPFVNLNDTNWVQPSSIDASKGGIEFFSSTPLAITCPLSGSEGTPVRVTGKATLGNIFGTIPGRYWSSTSETNWYVLSNWYYDEDKIYQANVLPLSTNEITILPGSVTPYVNLDNPSWAQPTSITVGDIGITFYSNEKKYVDCDIYGNAKYEGNSRYGAEPLIGSFWYSTTNNDWFNVDSWYMDRNKTVKADVGPDANTDVTIVEGSIVPFVNLDLPNWIQPKSIYAVGVGIRFFSNDNIDPPSETITCPIYGNPTFEGDAKFGIQTP